MFRLFQLSAEGLKVRNMTMGTNTSGDTPTAAPLKPSLDTPTCDTETRRFNQEAAKLGSNVEIWTISRDLPFAQKRWCGAAGVTAVKTLSDFRERAFGPAYGVEIKDGPIAGLTARAVFVVGGDGKVKHVEYVKEIGSEPNYDAALAAAKSASS